MLQALYSAAIGLFEKAEEIIMNLLQSNPKAIGHCTLLGWLCLKAGRMDKGFELMRQDFSNNRMPRLWYPVYSLVLNTQGFEKEAQSVLEQDLQYREDNDLIQIGAYLAPEAVMKCSELRKLVKLGRGFEDLASFSKENMVTEG